jgi:hypothetical protein
MNVRVIFECFQAASKLCDAFVISAVFQRKNFQSIVKCFG